MEPTYEQPQFELPKPIEPLQQKGSEEVSSKEAPKTAENASELKGQSVHLRPAPSAPSTPLPPTPPLANDQAGLAAATAQLSASDNDLIEKEWVDKAKQIVNRTREDPWTQSTDISKFKATYIKKRYNKDIKLSSS